MPLSESHFAPVFSHATCNVQEYHACTYDSFVRLQCPYCWAAILTANAPAILSGAAASAAAAKLAFDRKAMQQPKTLSVRATEPALAQKPVRREVKASGLKGWREVSSSKL